MRLREIGKTGIRASEIGMGTNTVSGQGTYGINEEKDGIAAVERAYDLGVTFYDTAEGYCEGRSEEVLGKVLGDKPDAVICTKVGSQGGPLTPERIRSAAEGSLRRLRRDVIDVYLLHNPETEQVVDPAIKEAMEALKKDGLIRSFGVSCHSAYGPEQGLEAIRQDYTSLQMNLNMAYQDIVDTVLPVAQEEGVGIFARVPLASGLLTGKYSRSTTWDATDGRSPTGHVPQNVLDRALDKLPDLQEMADAEGVPLVKAALAWVLTHEAVSSVIPGAKNPAQVEGNVAAADVTLSTDFVERVRTLR